MGIFDRLFGGSKKSARLDVTTRFQLDRHAFTGTMSKFHVAKEISSGKLYGLKFLDADKTAHFKSRFTGLNKPDEGAIAMKISHPMIVETFDYGLTKTGVEYILMEYIEGTGLDSVIRSKKKEILPHRLKMIREMVQAVQAVHEAGFIHRDVCPRNFICHQNLSAAKMIDFGLTIPNEAPYRLPGNRTGTPQYMAPEIVRRRPTDERVDIFSLGVTIYRMLTFEHPWGTTDTTGMAALNHDSFAVTDIATHLPDINEKLARAIHRCIEVNPDKRFKSCRHFLSAISSVKQVTQ